MAYKNIPVELETYEQLGRLCRAYGRKQGAQVKEMVRIEIEKLNEAQIEIAEISQTPKPTTKRAKPNEQQSHQ
jgi:predicted DNA-binding protein